MLHLLFVLIFIFDKKKEEEPEVLGKEKKNLQKLQLYIEPVKPQRERKW
jgi:hypothetical protein